MNKYAPDLSKANAGIPQLIGDFTFKTTDVKPFLRVSTDINTKENKNVFGVQYSLQVIEAEDENEKLKGKTIPLQLYMHTDGTEGINKRFLLASLGFALNEEDAFNEKYGEDADYNIGIEDDEKGEPKLGTLPADGIWKKVVGTAVRATCGMKQDKKDATRQNQQFDWKPF